MTSQQSWNPPNCSCDHNSRIYSFHVVWKDTWNCNTASGSVSAVLRGEGRGEEGVEFCASIHMTFNWMKVSLLHFWSPFPLYFVHATRRGHSSKLSLQNLHQYCQACPISQHILSTD